MGRTKPIWEGQRARIFDNEEYETIRPLNPIYFYDDFLGAWTAVPDVGVAFESGCVWSKVTVETVGAPTVALVADAANGIAQCAVDATAEAESSEGAAINIDSPSGEVITRWSISTYS